MPAPRPQKSQSANRKSQSPTTDWQSVAPWYDALVGESGSEFHQHVVLPNTLRLLALQPNQPVLDVACGQGVLARLLHSKGVEVTGVDAAPDLIRLARQRGPAPIHYHVADARDLSFLPEDHFAAAACILAIQNINPIAPVFQSIARTIQEGGRLVIVMMHPAFRGSKETSWGWDDTKHVQYRRTDRYLLPRKSPITAHPGRRDSDYTWTFHRPIEAYVKALRSAGLLVDALEEWPSHKHSTSGPRAQAENTARKEIPLFLALRAVKVAPPTPAADPGTTPADAQ